MIKKIKVEQLKAGMFVQDFNCCWLQHPFVVNQLKIKNAQQIETITHYGIREVYIDTDRGLDAPDAPTKKDIDQQIRFALENLPITSSTPRHSIPLAEELRRAKALLAHAKVATRLLMEDVRLGKQIDMHAVENVVETMTRSVLNNKDALVSLLRVKNKDEYTFLHSLAVSALCISFGTRLGFDDGKIRKIGIGGLLHDIGKVKIPTEILTKPGPLSPEEFAIVKDHVREGLSILRQTTEIDDDSLCVTAEHHERMDGSGYPNGLIGAQISLFGQMAAIIDTYDALTSERCYKEAIQPTDALSRIYEWSENYLNRNLVETFIAHLGIYPIGALVRLRSGFIGIVTAHGEKGLLYPVVRVVVDARKRRRIEPFDVNLSSQTADADEIVGCESSERLKIDPVRFLH
jgi:putative nucleotidyltransferase with HDIG domain